MLRVTIERDGAAIERVCQIVSEAPGQSRFWAYTCDQLPRESLLLRRWPDKVTGKYEYTVVAE